MLYYNSSNNRNTTRSDNMKNKEIYIVLTHTGTILSRIVKLYTKEEYTHVSISLDKELNQMYSFGRKYAYNPFIGGFVHESLKYGTFKRFKNSKTEIYSLKVTEEQYEKLEKIINDFSKKKELYKFNTIGLFLVALKYRYKKRNSFYCAEFVKYLFDRIKIKSNLPSIVKPNDFRKIEKIELVYHGILKKYKVKK